VDLLVLVLPLIAAVVTVVAVMTARSRGEIRPTRPAPTEPRVPSTSQPAWRRVSSAHEEGARGGGMREEPAAAGPQPTGWVPPDPARGWVAEIEWLRSGNESRFRVTAQGTEGRSSVVAESPKLPWPPVGTSSILEMTGLVTGLEVALERAGWRPLGPGDAWYAKRFGWEPVPAGSGERDAPREPKTTGRFQRSPGWPHGSEAWWSCEIQWNAGEPGPRFEAAALPPHGQRRRALAGAPAFKRLLGSGPDPRFEEHHARLRELVDRLEAAGWERAGRGSRWYAERFVWRRDGPPPNRAEPITSSIPPAT
jgi:hypothetical protein